MSGASVECVSPDYYSSNLVCHVCGERIDEGLFYTETKETLRPAYCSRDWPQDRPTRVERIGLTKP